MYFKILKHLEYALFHTVQFTALTRELPYNVHLLTLQSLGNGSYLLRLEHQFEMDEAPYNEPVTLSLTVSIYLMYNIIIATVKPLY